jgi:hypothetical protein
MMRSKKIAVILILMLILFGLAIIFVTGQDLLGYEGQPNNQYFLSAPEITRDLAIGQTFEAPVDGLHRIDVVLRSYNRRNTHPVTFYLKPSIDSQEVIYQESFNASEVRNNQWRTFEFSPILDSAGKSYYFYLESPDSVEGNAITVGGAQGGDFYNDGATYLTADYLGEHPTIVLADVAFRTYYGLSFKEKISILVQRMVENKPLVWGDIRFYMLLTGLYVVILVGVFIELVKLALRG